MNQVVEGIKFNIGIKCVVMYTFNSKPIQGLSS